MNTTDTKRKDTGDETFSVTARGHCRCIENGHCGADDCQVPKQKRRGLLSRAAGAIRRAVRR